MSEVLIISASGSDDLTKAEILQATIALEIRIHF